MPNNSQTVDDTLMRSIRARQDAFAFSAKDFSHLGSPAAIRKAFERLVKEKRLRRLRRGIYDRPRSHPLLGETPPNPMDLVRGMMKASAARWQPSGAHAANLLGLSEQVPAKIVILTDGPSRRVRVGNLALHFRRTAPRNLLGAGQPAGLVIQALRHLGANGVTPPILERLRSSLDANTKAELLTHLPHLPAWLRPHVEQITGK
jgi:hypothetical protein